MSVEVANRYGRRGGRGARAWLLVPKVLGVGTYFGSLVAAGVVSVCVHPRSEEEWRRLGETLSVIFRFAAVPGLLTAMVFGVLLLLQHPGVFVRMRWVQAKVGVLLVGVPALHFYMSGKVGALRHVHGAGWRAAGEAALAGFHGGVMAGLAVAVGLIWLGRHKPRLGQNVARVCERAGGRGGGG